MGAPGDRAVQEGPLEGQGDQSWGLCMVQLGVSAGASDWREPDGIGRTGLWGWGALLTWELVLF